MNESESEPPRSAFFTAGHAVGACLEGIVIKRLYFYPECGEVWIEVQEPELPDGHIWNHRDRASAKSLIRALLAGPAAQERYSFGTGGACDLFQAGSDIEKENAVWRAIDLAGRIEATSAVLPQLWREITASIDRDDVWAAVTAVAESLAASRELAGCEIEEIVRHATRKFRCRR